eukprot:UN01918
MKKRKRILFPFHAWYYSFFIIISFCIFFYYWSNVIIINHVSLLYHFFCFNYCSQIDLCFIMFGFIIISP